MSKEEAERSSAQALSSSTPPRPGASEPPRTLPSIPPSTDDIDTDWGAEQSATPAAEPLSATFDATALLRATVSATGTPLASPAPPAAPLPVVKPASVAPPQAQRPSVRPSPLRSQTLLGMPAVRPPAAPPVTETPSAPPLAPAVEAATPLSTAPNEVRPRQSPLRSRTLIGMAAPLPPTEPPAAPLQAEQRPPMPTPAPDVQTAPERARSSVPPPMPPPPPASTPPVAAPQAVSVRPPAPQFRPSSAVREHTPSTQPLAAASESMGSGRALIWLAVACLTLGVAGYVVLHRSSDEPLAAAPTPPTAVLAAAPALTPSPAVPSDEALAAPASAAPAASAEAAPAASSDAPVPGTVTVTVNSVPPKARIFHFGKQVGVAPWVVELKPGERHAYEVGLPGRVTRKLVLDGSKTEITVGLNPDP